MKQEPLDGQQALAWLAAGNDRFASTADNISNADQVPELAGEFGIGAVLSRRPEPRPFGLVLGCSDAQVPIESLFGRASDDLFVVRVAGNVLTDEGLASLEYAAQFLGSPLVFVLGHRGCGAVEATIKAVHDNASLPGHLPGLIDRLKPAVIAAEDSRPANLLNAAIAENVRRTSQAVAMAQPLLAGMVASGKVTVTGGVYDIATGGVSLA